MRKNEEESSFTFQKALEELAERIGEADGIPPLKPGEMRPPRYYLVNHYWAWGRKPLPPRKAIDKR